MRERLIELIQKSVKGCARNWAETIADYQLDNGVIALPCKVGDKVYVRYPVRKIVAEAIVDEISISRTADFIVVRDLSDNRRTATFFEQFGKTVFLTREEAEQALKEGVQD